MLTSPQTKYKKVFTVQTTCCPPQRNYQPILIASTKWFLNCSKSFVMGRTSGWFLFLESKFPKAGAVILSPFCLVQLFFVPLSINQSFYFPHNITLHTSNNNNGPILQSFYEIYVKYQQYMPAATPRCIPKHCYVSTWSITNYIDTERRLTLPVSPWQYDECFIFLDKVA